MVKERRSKLVILAEVLAAIQNGVNKPTRIMYAANMSWVPTKETLSNLMQRGFVTETKLEAPRDKRTRRTYQITPEGSKWLMGYKEWNIDT